MVARLAQPRPDLRSALTLEPQQLRQRAQRSRDQTLREKLLLVEVVLNQRRELAEARVVERIALAREQIELRTSKAADLGRDEVTLIRLSAQLYDLRQAALEELNRSSVLVPDPLPQLRKLGPFTFGDVAGWVERDIKAPDPQNTTPLPWLERLAHWLTERETASGLRRWLNRRPPLPEHLSQLYGTCQELKLKPVFQFFTVLDDSGIDLRVSWGTPSPHR